MSIRKTSGWDWTIEPGATGNYTYEQVQAAVLMDIRDELQTLNRLLGCQNFIEVPSILRAIRGNTMPKRKPKRRKP